MAKNKVSDWDVVANNNTDLTGTITLGEGMPPSYVNDAIREMMAQIKQWQSGASGDDYTINGTLNLNGELKLDSSSGTAGQVLVSQGLGATPAWGNAFVTGMIMLWSGSTSSVPSGWRLCDGGGGTPDLRDRFVVGAGNSYDVNATGGSKDAIAISHSHTASTSVTTKSQSGYFDTINRGGTSYRNPMVRRGGGTVSVSNKNNSMSFGEGWEGEGGSGGTRTTIDTSHNHSASTSVNSAGSSGTDKNLPPYYALAYIMKV
jgi:microcystin-dependent protein